MAFFSRRREPVVHAHRRARIHCHASADAVAARLDEYSGLSTGGSPVDVLLAETAGWTTVVLEGRLHPWAIHNLAMWLMDLPDGQMILVVDAAADEGLPGYWLLPDEVDSWLSGYDEEGATLSVRVPDNAMVRGEQVVHPADDPRSALARAGVPPELHHVRDGRRHTASLEDPGRDLNPSNAATHRSRGAMRDSGDIF